MTADWIKRALAKPLERFVFVPGRGPVLPHLTTSTTTPKLEIPHGAGSTAEYVREFERINNLKSTE